MHPNTMIYRLTTEDDQELVSLEIGLEVLRKNPNIEIRSVVNIKTYSEYLMALTDSKSVLEYIEVFANIANLREWMWEEFFENKPNVAIYFDEVVTHVKSTLLAAASEYNLKLE